MVFGTHELTAAVLTGPRYAQFLKRIPAQIGGRFLRPPLAKPLALCGYWALEGQGHFSLRV